MVSLQQGYLNLTFKSSTSKVSNSKYTFSQNALFSLPVYYIK